MIEGMDKLQKRLKQYENISLEKPVSNAIALVQQNAISNAPADSGELRHSLPIHTKQIGEGHVIGECSIGRTYGNYVEMGTGQRGQADHSGISPNVPVAYSQSPWWIHESQVDRSVAEKYHWFSIDTKDGRFYQCNGQPAQPFLYPALKDHEDECVDEITDGIRRQLK